MFVQQCAYSRYRRSNFTTYRGTDCFMPVRCKRLESISTGVKGNRPPNFALAVCCVANCDGSIHQSMQLFLVMFWADACSVIISADSDGQLPCWPEPRLRFVLTPLASLFTTRVHKCLKHWFYLKTGSRFVAATAAALSLQLVEDPLLRSQLICSLRASCIYKSCQRFTICSIHLCFP